MAARERGQRRVGQVTRWTAAGGGLAAVVIGVVLAQGPAAASTTASTMSGTAPSQAGAVPDAPQSGVQDTSPSSDGQGLQPPMQAPRHSHGGRSHTLSGGS
jgi:hypothetical protein